MSNTAASEFWTANNPTEKRTYLSGEQKKFLADTGTVITVLQVKERQYNDRRTGIPVPQWALRGRIANDPELYTLALSKNEGRDTFMQNLREYVDLHGPMDVCLQEIQPETGNRFYVLVDPDTHPANAQQTLDLDTNA